MTPVHVFFIAALTWLVWIPATLLQKRARGDRGGVSIFPVVPVFPLAAWLLAYAFTVWSLPLGAAIVGMAHVLLLVIMLGSCVRSTLAIRRLPRA